MTDQELEAKLKALTRSERRITAEILELIVSAEKRGLPQQRGFSNTIEWLVTDFAYSESAAYRRTQAARLLKECPGLSSKIIEGQISLSNLAKAQSLIKKHEQISQEKLSPETKQQILSKIENQTTSQAEKTLFSMLPSAADKINVDHLRQVSSDCARLTITIDNETLKALEYVRALLERAAPVLSWAQVIADLAKDYVSRKTPNSKKVSPKSPPPTAAAVKQSPNRHVKTRRPYIPKRIKRAVWDRAQNRCQYFDKQSQRRCNSIYYLDVDHIVPISLGGTNHLDNLRLLCGAHNQLHVDNMYGKKFMDKHRHH